MLRYFDGDYIHNKKLSNHKFNKDDWNIMLHGSFRLRPLRFNE